MWVGLECDRLRPSRRTVTVSWTLVWLCRLDVVVVVVVAAVVVKDGKVAAVVVVVEVVGC